MSDDEAEDELEKDAILDIPRPNPNTTPSVKDSQVLENDRCMALPVPAVADDPSEQECLFGLNKKILAARAEVARLKALKGIPRPSPTGDLPATPNPPSTPKHVTGEGKDFKESQEAILRQRISELREKLEAVKLFGKKHVFIFILFQGWDSHFSF